MTPILRFQKNFAVGKGGDIGTNSDRLRIVEMVR